MDIVQKLRLAASVNETLQEAAREIETLRWSVRERGKLLADIYNCEAAQKEKLPADLLKRIDDMLFFKRRDASANA